jgi:hypothetical protein
MQINKTGAMRRFYILAIASLIANVVSAQNINGILIDGITNQPLQDAHLIFTGKLKGTATGQSGFFNLKLSEEEKEEEVSVSYLGYETRYLKLSEVERFRNKPLILKLYPKPVELPEFIISAEDASAGRKQSLGLINEFFAPIL